MTIELLASKKLSDMTNSIKIRKLFQELTIEG
jgi:hypothetical protein